MLIEGDLLIAFLKMRCEGRGSGVCRGKGIGVIDLKREKMGNSCFGW